MFVYVSVLPFLILILLLLPLILFLPDAKFYHLIIPFLLFFSQHYFLATFG